MFTTTGVRKGFAQCERFTHEPEVFA
jgi:hypothetical protein